MVSCERYNTPVPHLQFSTITSKFPIFNRKKWNVAMNALRKCDTRGSGLSTAIMQSTTFCCYLYLITVDRLTRIITPSIHNTLKNENIIQHWCWNVENQLGFSCGLMWVVLGVLVRTWRCIEIQYEGFTTVQAADFHTALPKVRIGDSILKRSGFCQELLHWRNMIWWIATSINDFLPLHLVKWCNEGLTQLNSSLNSSGYDL